MGFGKSNSKREVDSNTILPQETRKTLKRHPNSTPKEDGKIRTKNLKVSKKKEIVKIRTKINFKK